MTASLADKEFAPRIVLFITREEDGHRLEAALDEEKLPICYQCRGKGTAPSEMLDIFGLSGTTRLITGVLLPRWMVPELLDTAERRLSLRQRGGGIALSIPIVGMQNPIYQMLNTQAREELAAKMKERTEQDMAELYKHSNHVAIMVAVASGYSDDVIDAARAAGAKGGTVIRGRRRNSERMSHYLGLAMQEEQEFLMIVVPREKKPEVLAAVNAACGLGSEAHGIVIALPVEDAIGLEG